MQIFNSGSFFCSIYPSFKDKVLPILQDKRNVITLIAVSILTLLGVGVFIYRKAYFSQMQISVFDNQNQYKRLHKVLKNDTVSSLKAQISQNTKAPIHEIELNHHNTVLQNDLTFKDYGIQNHSSLTLVTGVKIYLQTPDNALHSYRASENDTVNSLKEQISRKMNIPVSDIELRQNNRKLKDNHTLKRYGIPHAYSVSDTQLITRMQINLQGLDGKKGSYRVFSSDKVESLKKQIQQQEGIPADQIKLTSQGQLLADDCRLAEYGIVKEGSSILLTSHSIKETMEIYIKTLIGKTTTYHVSKDDTIESLKKKIEQKEDTPVDQTILIFAGKRLQDDHTCADYHIEPGSTIHRLLKIPSSKLGENE